MAATPVPFSQLNEDNLSEAIKEAWDGDKAKKAQEIAAHIEQHEGDGVANALAAFRSFVATQRVIMMAQGLP